MKYLGQSGIEVSKLCFGGNVFGWTIDEPTSFALLDAFADAGFNFIDTADVYSTWVPGNKGGESEAILGRWMKARGNRGKLVIATKVGMEVEGKKGLSRQRIFEAVEASLKRLQTDVIDLYQSHQDDQDVPLEETLGAFDALIRQGKVRAVGASQHKASRLAKALEASKANNLSGYQTLQPLYNLYDRAEVEAELAPVCEKNGLGIISFYSLAAGFLSGKYRSEADLGKSPRGMRTVKTYLNHRGLKILEALDTVAARQDSSNASVALAWLSSRPFITAPIVSATSLPQLEQMIASTRLKLSNDDLALLDRASAPEAQDTQIAS